MKGYPVLSFLLLCFVSVGLSVPFQRSTSRSTRLEDGRIRRVKRINNPAMFNMVPIFGTDLARLDPSPQPNLQDITGTTGSFSPQLFQSLQTGTPRTSYYLNQIFPYQTSPNGNNLISFRRYRTALPQPITFRSNVGLGELDQAEAIAENWEGLQKESERGNGQLRILGWLFGRPSYSPFPDYGMLESAAGVNRYPYGPRPMGPMGSMGHHGMGGMGPSYVVEECTELLDPMTHEIIEDCYEVPTMY